MTDWPAQSPDLNIIENLWADLKQQLSSHQVKSLDALWDICKDIWFSIPTVKIRHLYNSIPARIKDILNNNGYSSKY